jgi:hypothetical protein
MNIHVQFGFNHICSFWEEGIWTFQRSSSLKLMNWLNPNCNWMIIGMSFTKLLFFMPIGKAMLNIRLEQKTVLCRGPSKEHSCQVWFQLAQWFRRRSLKCEKFTDDERQVMAIVHMDLWSRWTKKGCFWWKKHVSWKFQRSSSLKLMNWLNLNCKWMIIGMSFTKFLFLCRSEIQDGCHRRTL